MPKCESTSEKPKKDSKDNSSPLPTRPAHVTTTAPAVGSSSPHRNIFTPRPSLNSPRHQKVPEEEPSAPAPPAQPSAFDMAAQLSSGGGDFGRDQLSLLKLLVAVVENKVTEKERQAATNPAVATGAVDMKHLLEEAAQELKLDENKSSAAASVAAPASCPDDPRRRARADMATAPAASSSELHPPQPVATAGVYLNDNGRSSPMHASQSSQPVDPRMARRMANTLPGQSSPHHGPVDPRKPSNLDTVGRASPPTVNLGMGAVADSGSSQRDPRRRPPAIDPPATSGPSSGRKGLLPTPPAHMRLPADSTRDADSPGPQSKDRRVRSDPDRPQRDSPRGDYHDSRREGDHHSDYRDLRRDKDRHGDLRRESEHHAEYRESRHEAERSDYGDVRRESDHHSGYHDPRRGSDRHADYRDPRRESDRHGEYHDQRHDADRHASYRSPRREADRQSDYHDLRREADRQTEYREARHETDRQTDCRDPRHEADHQSDYRDPRSAYSEKRHGRRDIPADIAYDPRNARSDPRSGGDPRGSVRSESRQEGRSDRVPYDDGHFESRSPHHGDPRQADAFGGSSRMSSSQEQYGARHDPRSGGESHSAGESNVDSRNLRPSDPWQSSQRDDYGMDVGPSMGPRRGVSDPRYSEHHRRHTALDQKLKGW